MEQSFKAAGSVPVDRTRLEALGLGFLPVIPPEEATASCVCCGTACAGEFPKDDAAAPYQETLAEQHGVLCVPCMIENVAAKSGAPVEELVRFFKEHREAMANTTPADPFSDDGISPAYAALLREIRDNWGEEYSTALHDFCGIAWSNALANLHRLNLPTAVCPYIGDLMKAMAQAMVDNFPREKEGFGFDYRDPDFAREVKEGHEIVMLERAVDGPPVPADTVLQFPGNSRHP